MASIRKARNKWLAEIRSKGVYKSKTFYSKIEAQSWAIEIERQLGKFDGMPSSYTLADAFKKYAEEVSVLKKGGHWEKIRLNKLSAYSFSYIRLEDLRNRDIQNWIDQRLEEVSAASVNREINLISAVITTSRRKWKWHSNEPMKDIERPKNPKARDRRISEVEILKILRQFDYVEGKEIKTKRDQIAVGFLIALETAMRQGELFGLTWDNVFLEQSFVHLPDTKNGTSRDVPLSKRAVELFVYLKQRTHGDVFTVDKSVVSTLFRRAIKNTDIQDLKFHDTRHEALTRLARKIDVLDLARMVGHRDPRSLMIYYNPTATEIAVRLG